MIITRTFYREVVQTSLGVGLVIVSIVGVVRLVRLLSDAADGEIPVDSILMLLGLKIVFFLDLIIPIVVYVALLMVISRWMRDSEMVVMQACGISLGRLLRASVPLMLVVTAIVAAVSLYLAPKASAWSEQILEDFKNQEELGGIAPGIFHESRSGIVYFVERLGVEANTLYGVFVYRADPEQDTVVVAHKGYQYIDEATGDRFLVLESGWRYEGRPGAADYGVMEFATYALRIRQRQVVKAVVGVKSRPTQELMGLTDQRSFAEFHWRFSKPLVVPVLILFAISFGYLDVRKGQLSRLLWGLGLFFLYNNALGYGHALLRRGDVTPETGLWAVHVVFLALAGYMFIRRDANRGLLPRWRRA
ncbi:MAG: LPS export ABC transporter permease LptF [Gammaproteobacteria bacterium]|nr:LPS export ABC transporter permease LptF [Gammaproteobacteria bacterium]